MSTLSQGFRKLFTATPTSTAAPREIRPLQDVRSYAESCGSMIASSAEIDTLLQALGPDSAAEKDWRQSPCYPAPYLAEFSDVTVIPGCRILLQDEGNALSDEIDLGFRKFGLRPKLWDMEVTEGPLLHFPPHPTAPNPIPCGIHITGEHETNYFHWIVEVLPRLFLCEKLLTDKHTPILVSDGLHANLYALLDMIRTPERPVLKLQKGHSYPVTRLIYPSDITRILDTYNRAPGTDTTYLPVTLLREIAASVKKSLNFAAIRQHKHLFVRRDSSYRRMLNASAIESMLVEQGYHALDPGTLSIEEQIDIFSQAESIVGPSGAGMANMLWCKPETRITILHSDHPFKKYPYWDALARASGAKIDYLAGPRAYNVTDSFEAHDDFSISPEALANALESRSSAHSESRYVGH